MSNLTTTSKNPGANERFLTELRKLEKREIAQGWPESGDDKTAPTIAAINYFGSDDGQHPPPRDALSPSLETTTPAVTAGAELAGQSAAKGTLDQSGLESAARTGTDAIKREVRNFSTPRNAPATIKKKGFDNPLIGKDGEGRILKGASAELRDRS